MPSSSETTTANPTRELAAIVFSDIAGYTALMGRDERAAVRALAGHRDLVRSLVPRFNGRMGYGVNAASRIHALAPPGGICISERVYDDVRNKPEIQVRDLGQKTLKNVVRPIRVYMLQHAGGLSRRPWEPGNGRSVFAVGFAAVALSILAVGAYAYRDAIRGALAPRLVEAGKATVAVLPFANLSGSKDDEYFSDGISDEVRGDLTKIAGLQVIARTSSYAFKGQNEDVRKIARLLSVRNVLEGSVRRSTDRVRIEVELIDATSGFSLWSETYDRAMADVFAIQSDIAQGVADKLRVTLLPGEKARVERKPTDNLEAYNLYLRGLYYLTFLTGGSGTGGSPMKAIDSFSAAIAKDPNFADAYVARATAYGLAGLLSI